MSMLVPGGTARTGRGRLCGQTEGRGGEARFSPFKNLADLKKTVPLSMSEPLPVLKLLDYPLK